MERPVSLTPGERRALSAFKAAVQSALGENLVSLRLFGSRARGEGDVESDLDVLVVVRIRDRSVCRRIVEAALDVDLTHGTNLAPTILSVAEYDASRECHSPFYGNVERESVAL
jgi:predicted nucleotidyltransferase